jgi:hypothetical protein
MGKFASCALVCALIGCGRGAASHEPTPAPKSTGWEQAQGQPVAPLALGADTPDCCQSCPLALEGVKLQYAESGGGAVMLFTTSDESEQEELRRRVAELAAYHNHKQHKLAMMTLPHRANMQPIEGGARLDLVPRGLDEPRVFRSEVEREVQWMQKGHCPPLGERNECASCDLRKE